MKRILTSLLFFLSLTQPVSALVVDTFDTDVSQVVTKRGDFVGGGKPGARVPMVKSETVPEDNHGKVLKIEFNVSTAFGGVYLILNEKQMPSEANAMSFRLKGTPSSFKVELKDETIHSFIVPKSNRSEWIQVVVPFKDVTNAADLKPEKIHEIVFVFEDHRSSPRLGTILIDDVEFMRLESLSNVSSDIKPPSELLVNGKQNGRKKTVLQDQSSAALSLETSENDIFETLRFEASWDGKHWFYIGEEKKGQKKNYTLTWPVSLYPSGSYWVRAVYVTTGGIYAEGMPREIEIKNSYRFDKLLNEVQRKAFDYFVQEVDPIDYLVKDRTTPDSPFSTGLSGFQITSYVIGVERGWMERKEAVKRINRVMEFMIAVQRYHGLIPHWLGSDKQEVWEKGMGDVVETSFVLAGALTAQAYFRSHDKAETQLREKVDRFYRAIDWKFLAEQKSVRGENKILPWHWSQEKGASELLLRGYHEALFVYLLAMGAPENALSEGSWQAWASTYQRGRYGPYELISCAPLFTHQYPHLWIDFREKKDRYTNYFENSILATLANREFSLKENKYPLEIWGLTASEGPNNYKAYGAAPLASQVPVINDGTIAPTAALTSIMFTPQLSLAAMRQMKDKYEDKVWGVYGFKDAFNPKMKWFSDVYLGLDQGPIVIGIENYRTGLIWKLLGGNPHVKEGFKKANFRRNGTSGH